jgi:hypothetical protein
MYSVGNLVLIHQDTCGKLAKPTRGPYWLIDVAHQHVNGTVYCHEWFESLMKCSTFGDWFHLNLTKTIEDTICHTTWLTTLFLFW